jgi:hypothetical protein
MGLSTIQQSLSRGDFLYSLGSEGDVQERAKLSGILPDTGARVPELLLRKNATELCTFLNITFGSERVQKVTQPPREGSLNLEGDVQERAKLSGILPDTGARVPELLHHDSTDASQKKSPSLLVRDLLTF